MLLVNQFFNPFTIAMFVVAGCAFIGILLFLGYDKYIKPKKEKKKQLASAEKQIENANIQVAENSKTKVCPECGAEILQEGNFCPKCGHKIQ